MKNSDRLFVNEVYVIENGICKGWQQVNKYMTIKNINKMFKEGNVETVNVMEKKEDFIGADFNYKTFRIEYPTLETYFERLVDEAKDKIRFEQGIELPEEIKIDMVSANTNWDGIYYNTNKRIEMRMSFIRAGFEDVKDYCGKRREEKIISVIVHEIGHLVHDLINKLEYIELPTEGKSGYAKTNHMEDFAEAFMDLVMANRKETYRRDMAMMNILAKGI